MVVRTDEDELLLTSHLEIGVEACEIDGPRVRPLHRGGSINTEARTRLLVR